MPQLMQKESLAASEEKIYRTLLMQTMDVLLARPSDIYSTAEGV
jgi:hypothetical protein